MKLSETLTINLPLLEEKKHYIKSNGSIIAGPFNSEMEADNYLLKLQQKAKPEDELDDAEVVFESTSMYKPGYDAELKTPRGSVTDWLDKMGVSKEDLQTAYKEAQQLDSYKKLAEKFKVKNLPKSKANGTFNFLSSVKPYGRERTYIVYANGVIRVEGFKSTVMHHITRLKAPKPRLIAGNPVKSMVSIYDNAFKELLSKEVE